jgi:hypothetical protein
MDENLVNWFYCADDDDSTNDGYSDDGEIASGTCASEWNAPSGGGTCGETQYGCPSTACDGDSKGPWCPDDDNVDHWFYCADDYSSNSTDDHSTQSSPTATICVLRDTTVCWGNLHRYIARTGTSPFDGIDVGRKSAPALADLDDDGDLDLVVGEWDGVLNYYENVGNATSPTYEAVDGAASPFDGIDVYVDQVSYYGAKGSPAFADVDGDGDLDLVVGESDGDLHYYENVGNATSPTYAAVNPDQDD